MVASERGCNIVTNNMEYLSNVIAWLGQREKGVQIRFAKNREGTLLPEDIEKELDERTAVLSISQVTWGNGFRHDIKTLSEIAHENGAYIVVDGIQCVGAMKIDVKKEGIDGVERVALSFGMSIAITALIGFGLNYTTSGIRLEPVLYSIFCFIIVMSAIALIRQKKLTGTRLSSGMKYRSIKATQELLMKEMRCRCSTGQKYYYLTSSSLEKLPRFYLFQKTSAPKRSVPTVKNL